jgi:hypothetical protein
LRIIADFGEKLKNKENAPKTLLYKDMKKGSPHSSMVKSAKKLERGEKCLSIKKISSCWQLCFGRMKVKG